MIVRPGLISAQDTTNEACGEAKVCISEKALNRAFEDAKKADKYNAMSDQAKLFRAKYYGAEGKIEFMAEEGKKKDAKIEENDSRFSGAFWFWVGVGTTILTGGGVFGGYLLLRK